jgi:3-hydroxyacyl-CoA dehydrogenase/enoyl-CoA hydratase/3-hydroxybutyryl-CoA epimerase
MDYVRQIKRTPIVVNDNPGFYVNRVFISFVAEGMCMLAEGIEPALIECAAAMAGMHAGPLAAADEAGLGLQREVIRQMEPGGRDDRARLGAACNVIERMTQYLKRLGRRSGAGFYDYPPGGAAQLWPGLKAHFPPRVEQPDVEEVKQRLLCIQALESARCLEEGVVTHSADADLGAVLGVGFPTWTGGTLSFIETVGLERFVAECERMAARYGQRFQPSCWLVARARRRQRFYGAIKE